MGIDIRGNSYLNYRKKTCDLQLYESPQAEHKLKISLAGLRSDDDWILDALYNEPLRIRSVMAHQLWLDLHEPHYLARAPEAKAGARARHCEVFLNGSYEGIYSLSEQVDRKQLDIQKPGGSRPVGTMLKSIGYTPVTSFQGYYAPAPNASTYLGYEWEFPEGQADWSKMEQLLLAGLQEYSTSYNNDVFDHFVVDNLVDYYLFVNLGRIQDNLSKNVFFCQYSHVEPYFLVPWDLDAVYGNTFRGQQDTVTHMMRYSTLFLKLLNDRDSEFYTRCKDRYHQWRTEGLSAASQLATFDSLYNMLKSTGAYARESLVQSNLAQLDARYSYLVDWVEKRYSFLDRYFGYHEAHVDIQEQLAELIRIGPNPATTRLTIAATAELHTAEVELYALTGQSVAKTNLRAASATLDVSQLPAGHYVVRVGHVTKLVTIR